MRIPFRLRPVPLLATILVVALGISLGRWQDRRAGEKLALAARIDAGNAAAPLRLHGQELPLETARYRKIAVTGTFLRDWPLYLDNRPHAGRAGFVLLMPLRIEGSAMHVLVARGWLPRNAQERTRIAAYPTPDGQVTIEGLARPDAGHLLELGAKPVLRPGAIVQNAAPVDLARASGLALEPFVIEQASPDGSEGALARDWPAPDLGVDKHRGYAFQWYALALTALVFFIVSGYRRGRVRGNSDGPVNEARHNEARHNEARHNERQDNERQDNEPRHNERRSNERRHQPGNGPASGQASGPANGQ